MPSTIKRVPWTDAELDTLREQARCRSATELAEMLGRHAASVRYKLLQLGLAARPINHSWTMPEIRLLRERWADTSAPVADIAAELGLTVGQVRGQVRGLGMARDYAARDRRIVALAKAGKHNQEIVVRVGIGIAAVRSVLRRHAPGLTGGRRTWTEEEDEQLRRMRAAGAGTAAIAAGLGRSRGAILKRSPIVCGPKFRRRPYTTAEKESMRRWLLEGVAIKNIAARLGRTYSSVQVTIRANRFPVPTAAPMNYERWSASDLTNLDIRVADGMNDAQIAADLGRTVLSVASKRRELRRRAGA